MLVDTIFLPSFSLAGSTLQETILVLSAYLAGTGHPTAPSEHPPEATTAPGRSQPHLPVGLEQSKPRHNRRTHAAHRAHCSLVPGSRDHSGLCYWEPQDTFYLRPIVLPTPRDTADLPNTL